MFNFRIFKPVLIIFLSLFSYTSLMAGTRGKLAGTVLDKSTGQSVIGANIYLYQTSLGAATNIDGQYMLINIPPGMYTVRVEYIGYQTQQLDNVRIAADLTTVLNFEILPAALESEETITVIAERPLIYKDVTSKLAIVDGDEIAAMPVDNFNDVVASQAGITTDAEGNLHFRGGRTNEVTFLIDGQPVDNPINNTFGGLIDNYAIRELQVLSGTFNAEYGQAMSGIINIVTNEGSDKFKVKIEYTSPMLNESVYRKPNALVQDANPIYDKENNLRLTYKKNNGLENIDPLYPYEGNFNGYFSGPLPGFIGSYFLSGEYKNENEWKPFGYDFSRSMFGKISIPVGPSKLILSMQYSDQEVQPYNHKFKYLANNQGHWENQSKRMALQYNHVLSPNSFLVINASYLDHKSLFRVRDLHYSDYIFPELDEHIEFAISGNSKEYSDFQSDNINFKADWVFQYGQHHEFKTGFDFNQYNLSVFDYTNEGNNEEEYFLNEYVKNPVTTSVYVQDKIEYSSIILNGGLRIDHVNVEANAFRDIENPFSGKEPTKSELKVSPRIGLAYPISENTVFHFSYGHFFQFPNFQEIYRNLQFLNVDQLSLARFALVANPKVRSQKTISYEFGISQKIGDNYAINLTTYSKDITDLLGTIYVETLYRYAIFTNNDFARIQGVDLSFEKRMSNFWSAKLDYTYSVARGNEATPTEEAYNIYEGREKSIKELYLDFDRRHDIAVNMTIGLPAHYGPNLSGIFPFERLTLSLLAQFSSGLPYTPISDDRSRTFEKNSARMPWTKTVDIRIEKFIPLSSFTLSIFFEGRNLFDWLNPLIVQPRTGKLWDDGKSTLFGTGKDFMHNPKDIAPPRIVKLGMSIAL